ncbi:MAG: transcriptional regulator, AraC family [Phenylobacterium sp.]|uniref:helix-turn-helix domain-containing protein n=1 Tax=Phenylobacterium sp. TaxID=1871053 RepID=UPI00260A2696|nr:AraC family transcriptional regulator [Phenylobacterium sp.]MDB5496563.1 transcriptional regulator, AraC family [Phenylobacterium sp.]
MAPLQSGPDNRARGDWRTAFLADNPGGAITSVRQKTWSGLSAVVKEMAFTGAFEVDRAAAYCRLMVILEEVGGRIHARTGRKTAAARPDAPHRVYFVPAEAPFWTYAEKLRYVRYVSLQFSETDLAALVGDRFKADLPQSPRLAFFEPRLLALARLFEAECRLDGPSDPLLGDSLSISLLSLLKGMDTRDPPAHHRGGLSARQIKAVTDYLESHVSEKVDPLELARLTGLSVSHFHRAFKESTGMPPHTWLTDLRIRRARELVLAADRPLADIALETGFSDQPHFTRVFSKLVGASPGAWRRAMLS